MSFEVHRLGKLADHLESIAYDWMESAVLEHYGIDELTELTQEQIDEIWEYSESDDCFEAYAGMALRSICENAGEG